MNPITKAISEIMFTIPREVLQMAFMDSVPAWNQSPISLDERIRNSVLRPRVLTDCDFVGGIEAVISLESLGPCYSEVGHLVYQIPKNMTDDRSIVSVLSLLGITTTQHTFIGQTGLAGNELTAAAARVGASYSAEGPSQSAKTELIGENTVLIKYHHLPFAIGALRVVLGNDEEMVNISPRSYLAFAQLCIFAVKSYVYNTMVVKMDTAVLYGGHELGAIRNVIEGYSDAEEMYREYLRNTWTKIAFMSDNEQYMRYLKTMVSPGL